MSLHEREMWEDRWKSVDASIESLQRQVAAADLGSAGTTLGTTLASLQAFVANQYKFFLDGFHEGWLEASPQFPPEFALREILGQVSFDLTVLSLAISQRLDKSKKGAAPATLAKADQLAYAALKPAIDAGLLDDTAVITHVQKQASIRLIPYASVAIIGLPLNAISAETNPNLSRDLLAIPHEIGHYVFRHGTIDGERIKVALRDRLTGCEKWLYRWKEELFSDVYATCVAGPVMALDFQDVMVTKSTNEYLDDDGVHPIPALRPDTFHLTLQATKQKGSVKQLKKRWRKIRDVRINTDEFTASPGTQYEKDVWLDEARHEIKSYVKAIVGLDAWPTKEHWGERWSTGSLDATLYDEFHQFMLACNVTPPTATLKGKTASVGKNKWTVGHYAQRCVRWLDTVRQQGVTGKFKDGDKIPPEVWTQILMVNDWITGVSDENAFPG